MHSPCAVCVAACNTQRAHHAPQRHWTGTCGMKWQGVHAADARHSTSCTTCSATAPGRYVVLVSVPRQRPSLTDSNSKARSKRNCAPSFVLLGSAQSCMSCCSPTNHCQYHDDIIIHASAYRISHTTWQHRAAARPPQKPGLRPIGQRTRNADTAQRTGRLCATGRLRIADATRTDATCNAHRCNMQHATSADATHQRAPMQRATRADALCNMGHAPMHRVTRTGAARPDATCNMRRAPMQRATPPDAPMQHASMRHGDATYKAINCADATRNARRCNVHIASRTGAACTACTLAAPGRYVASAHGMPRCIHPSVSDGVAPSATIRQASSHAPRRPHAPYTVHRSPQHACAAPCAPSIGHAAPRNMPYHGAGDAPRALGARTVALVFEIEPPLNVTAPSSILTTPPPNCAQAGAATPIAIGPAPRPPTPAPTAASGPTPIRTVAVVPDIATVSNSAVPLTV